MNEIIIVIAVLISIFSIYLSRLMHKKFGGKKRMNDRDGRINEHYEKMKKIKDESSQNK